MCVMSEPLSPFLAFWNILAIVIRGVAPEKLRIFLNSGFELCYPPVVHNEVVGWAFLVYSSLIKYQHLFIFLRLQNWMLRGGGINPEN